MAQRFPLQCVPTSSDTSVRAFRSLTRRDADAVRSTVRAAASGFSVQEHDDYDGYLSLVVTAADTAARSYVVTGQTGAVEIAALHQDEMVPLGKYPSIGAAMIVLRSALEQPEPAVDQASAVASADALVARHGPDATLHAALLADARPGHIRWAAVLRALDTTGPVQ